MEYHQLLPKKQGWEHHLGNLLGTVFLHTESKALPGTIWMRGECLRQFIAAHCGHSPRYKVILLE